MTLFKGAYQFFEHFVPGDSCRQISAKYYIDRVLDLTAIKTVVDLGCGTGKSADYFKQKNPDIRWVGVDIESSPEVNMRERADVEFLTFDGVHLPFGDGEIDLIYCHQVLEHVRAPRKLLAEVKKCLKPGGYFIGATSHLEPYHSYSYWNYTPYGFVELIKESGLQVDELRPGIDAFTLFTRKAMGNPKILNCFFTKETPINMLIGLLGFLCGKRNKEINLLKLMFCGQFSFMVHKD